MWTKGQCYLQHFPLGGSAGPSAGHLCFAWLLRLEPSSRGWAPPHFPGHSAVNLLQPPRGFFKSLPAFFNSLAVTADYPLPQECLPPLACALLSPAPAWPKSSAQASVLTKYSETLLPLAPCTFVLSLHCWGSSTAPCVHQTDSATELQSQLQRVGFH